MFLFFSGYGVWFSIHKANSVKTWLTKHIKKLLLPFGIVLISFEAIECFITKTNGIVAVLKDVLTLSLPHYTNWFVKAILVMYIVSALAYLISRKIPYSYEISVLGGCMIWMIACKFFHLASFWYNSILAFALGSVVARYKIEAEKVLHKYFWQVLVLLCVCSAAVVWRVGSLSGTIGNLVFCLDALFLIGIYGANSKILYCLGKVSFEIYLWHLLFKYYLFISTFSHDGIIIIVIILSIVTAFFENYIISGKGLG